MSKNFSDIVEMKTDCSITQSFDAIMNCWSMGSQIRNRYRYGENKDCSEKWQDFKFCFRVKKEDEEGRKRLLQERQREKDAKKAKEKNSLDIWELREKPLENFLPEIPKKDATFRS
ncbi:9580_t:CDS:2 [Ambispora gerdemannii]|uniref:9580_t:CDS:1 n=1 Tax=Ambispora gerdemannii TaxID=144530 RepID=A0A9N9F1S4_9GLOM|nr:9580_t:CDS:2 [Ambispora gerdemannii]